VARAGDVLESPATGERLVFLRTAAETGGEVLEYELERLLFAPFAALGRARGYRARYPEDSHDS
jgi:hypothetical protein